MDRITLFILSVFLISSNAVLYAADEAPTSKRFYAGKILRAEVQPDNESLPVMVKNTSKYEPKSRLTADVGYALVTVMLDRGRSLGMYDYSLVNSGKRVFPCIALVDTYGEYDGGRWEIKKTSPTKKYTMLFQVQLPPTGQPEYNLRFNLLKNKSKDIPLKFVDVKDRPFTHYRQVPTTGMLGVNPYKEKPVVEPDTDEPAADAKPKAEAGEKISEKDIKNKADKKDWEDMMGDSGKKKKDTPKKEAPKKEDKKKDDKKKEKKAAPKKGKKDAWDDWKE